MLFTSSKSSQTLTKVLVFLFFSLIGWLVLGYTLAGREGLFGALLLTTSLVMLLIFKSESPILKHLKAAKISGQDAWGLKKIIEKYSHQLRISPPELYIFEHETGAALSLDRPWGKPAVAISTGALKRLNTEEINAVLAHELCHIYRMNTFGLTTAHLAAQAWIGAAQTVDELIPKNKYRFFARIAAPVAQLILKQSIREKVFFENDDMTISILNDRRVLAEALWKLDVMAKTAPLNVVPCSSHFFTVNPDGSRAHKKFLLTHPKIDRRVQRLLGYWPI